jgi:phosphoglycerate kinase
VSRAVGQSTTTLTAGSNPREKHSETIKRSSNGPLGAFEVDEFADGTVDIARAMALAHWRGAFTVVGGGDTVAALRKAEVLETEISHVSTGGGASLKFIGGEELPGIAVLSDKAQ